jgi:hypothetical protein
MGSNSGTSGPNVVKTAADRQTDMDEPIRCSLLMPEHEEHLKTHRTLVANCRGKKNERKC